MSDAYPPDPGTGSGSSSIGMTSAGREDSQSVGDLLGEVTRDLSTLIRQEIELAKAELKQEATKAGAGAGMLGGAGLAGYFVLLFGSVAVMAALHVVMPLGWAALIVAVIWAVIGAVLFASGRGRLKQVNPKPQQTIDTLKEDAQWAKHPTR